MKLTLKMSNSLTFKPNCYVFCLQGFVFLDTYDLREYNPFLLNIKTPHYLKVIICDLIISFHKSKKESFGHIEVIKMCLSLIIYTLLFS